MPVYNLQTDKNYYFVTSIIPEISEKCNDIPMVIAHNCRCTLVAVVDGADPYNPNLRKSEYLEEEGLTYDEWKVQHSGKTKSVSNSFDRSSVNYTKFGQHLKGRLDSADVEWREVQMFEKQPSENDIINRLCGGDITKGSCASLACAYAGNKNGLNVLDFRDGKSRDIFANGGLNDIANLHDVVAKYEPKGGVNPAKKLQNEISFFQPFFGVPESVFIQ